MNDMGRLYYNLKDEYILFFHYFCHRGYTHEVVVNKVITI